jgi:endonuclease/exonuclease/phosphatase family metal-dependent hydrolase
MISAVETDTTSPSDRPRAGKRRWLRRGLLLVAIVPVMVGMSGYMRWQTAPASGDGAVGALPSLAAEKVAFRVGTFNMHSGVGEDERFDLSRTIESLRGMDLCGLNEVRGRLFGEPRNQAQELAQATACAWLFIPSERRFWHDDFGNGVLTRLPIAHWVRTPLPTEPHHGGFRSAAVLRTEFGSQSVQVLVTHIDRDTDQANQIRFVTRLYDSLQPPAMLLGDLNANSDNPQVETLLNLPGVHDCISEATQQKRGRIDWILARGLKTVSGGQVANGASDHPCYWVEVALPH